MLKKILFVATLVLSFGSFVPAADAGPYPDCELEPHAPQCW